MNKKLLLNLVPILLLLVGLIVVYKPESPQGIMGLVGAFVGGFLAMVVVKKKNIR
jgi:hypothetical protein